MPRTVSRLLAIGSALGLASLAGTAQTGNLKDYRMEAKPPADPSGKLGQLREGKLKTAGPDEKANRELLRAVAKYQVYKATEDRYYVQPETAELRPRDQSATFDQVLVDVGGQLLQPGPETKYLPPQAEYIAAYGAALNEAVRDVLKTNPPAPIRVNTGRLLALGAKSGAGAFAPTIHELLTNTFPLDKGKPARTPPDLLLYAIDAAGNLFAAYDPLWHLNPDYQTQFRHSFDNKDRLTLARDLLDLLAKGPGVAELAAPPTPDQPVQRVVREDGSAADVAAGDPKQPDAKPPAPKAETEAATAAEQQAVTRYFRRHIATAVSKIRADVITEVGQPPVKPVVAIARIAVDDASLNPPATTPEVAEAVLGLCYLAPSQQTLNVPEVLTAIAAGTQTLVRDYTNRRRPDIARNAQLVPWKLYAERLNAAVDHLSRQATTNARWISQRAAIGQLATALREDVVVPLRRDEAQTPPSSNRLTEFLAGRAGGGRTVFTDDPASALNPRNAAR